MIRKSLNSFINSCFALCCKLTGSIFSRAGSGERDSAGGIALGDGRWSGAARADEGPVSAIGGGTENGTGFPAGPRACVSDEDDSGICMLRPTGPWWITPGTIRLWVEPLLTDPRSGAAGKCIIEMRSFAKGGEGGAVSADGVFGPSPGSDEWKFFRTSNSSSLSVVCAFGTGRVVDDG